MLDYKVLIVYLDDAKKLRQKFQIKKARDVLHQSIDEPMNFTELTKELGISERILHHAFKANYGMTPKKYLLALRMHKIQEELLLVDPGTTTISAVIEKHHFF